MRRRLSKRQIGSGAFALVALAASGTLLALNLSGSGGDQGCPDQWYRHADGFCYAWDENPPPTTTGEPAVGQTLEVTPTIKDSAKAVALIDDARAALPKTTISGVAYFAAPGPGYWRTALSAMTLGQVLSQYGLDFDTAGNNLMVTTIPGKKYFAHPERYVGGKWDLGMQALAHVRAEMVANPHTEGPTVTIKR